MTKLILLFSSLFMMMFLSCKNYEESNKAGELYLEDNDYDVISAALDLYLENYKRGSYPKEDSVFYKGSGNRFPLALIIPDSTEIEYLSNWSYDKHKDLKIDDKYVTDRIKTLNKKSFHIDISKITTFKTYPNRINGKIRKLEDLYILFPDAWGMVGFSKPSIDIENRIAVIYIFFVKGGLWGKGNYLWLRKENGNWKIYDNIELWIS